MKSLDMKRGAKVIVTNGCHRGFFGRLVDIKNSGQNMTGIVKSGKEEYTFPRGYLQLDTRFNRELYTV